MKRIIFFLIIFLNFISFYSYTSDLSSDIIKTSKNSQIIILKNGREYKGHLIKITDSKINFEIEGHEKSFNKVDVTRIQFHRNRLYEEFDNINQLSDEEIIEIYKNSKKIKITQNEQIAILLDKTYIKFLDNNKISLKIKKGIKILNERGKDFSTQYFYYLKGFDTAELLYGLTISKDGSLSTVDESAINDEPINNKENHYNRLRRVKFGLKDVDIGSVLIWEAEIIKETDELINPFINVNSLVSYHNTIKKIIEVHVPMDIEKSLNYSFYKGLISSRHSYVKETSSMNDKIYIYEENNIESYINDEEKTPSDSMIYPKLYFTNDNYWKKISNEYYEKHFNDKNEEYFKEIALEVIGNERNGDKIIEKLYSYINRSIKLSNVSMKNFQYIPHDYNSLINLPSLNILDKSYFFTRLANSIGLNCKMYLFRKNFNSKIPDTLSSLAFFDSVVCELKYKGKEKYMSFENENFSPGQTYFSVSEASCLVVNSPESRLSKLSLIPYTINRREVNYDCILNEDNSLHIKRTTTIYGPSQAAWRTKRFLSKDKMDKYMKSRVNNLGNNVKLKKYRFLNHLDDFGKPVILEEYILLRNFSYSSGKHYKLFKIPGISYNAGSVSKSERELPFDLETTKMTTYRFTLSFPGKYRLEYFPSTFTINNSSFTFTADYSVSGNKLSLNINDIYKKQMISTKDYSILKNSIEKKAKLLKEWIILGDGE